MAVGAGPCVLIRLPPHRPRACNQAAMTQHGADKVSSCKAGLPFACKQLRASSAAATAAAPPAGAPNPAARAHLLEQLRDDLLEALHHQRRGGRGPLPCVNHALGRLPAGEVHAALRLGRPQVGRVPVGAGGGAAGRWGGQPAVGGTARARQPGWPRADCTATHCQRTWGQRQPAQPAGCGRPGGLWREPRPRALLLQGPPCS